MYSRSSSNQLRRQSSLQGLFGSPDDLMFRSSMTLFATAEPDGPYQAALARRCDDPDPSTLGHLRGGESR